jgi:hypothetical protein
VRSAVAALLLAPTVLADVAYQVTINTSPVSGTAGFVDFQFNPANPASQAITAQILSFTSDGSLSGAPMAVGSVAGVLPAPVTFTNNAPLNEYFQGFIYGNTISFLLLLSGPGINSPIANNAGSTFGIGLYDSAQQPILTDQGLITGFAGQVDILNGIVTTTGFPTQTNGPSVVTFTPTIASNDFLIYYWFFAES